MPPLRLDPDEGGPLRWVDGLMLLCGHQGDGGLADETGRPEMSLPLTPRRRAWDEWADLWRGLHGRPGADGRLTLLHPDDLAGLHRRLSGRDPRWRVARDLGAHRGTAGLLADACRGDADPDGWLLAGHGRATPTATAAETLAELKPPPDGCDVMLLHHRGLLQGLWLVRRRVLSAVPAIGYVDFKEQLLEQLDADGGDERIGLCHVRRPLLRPLTDRAGYLEAVAAHHPTADAGRPSFGFVENDDAPPADVRLYDSVILHGGRAEPPSVLARCVVAGGGRVPGRSVVENRTIAAPRRMNPLRRDAARTASPLLSR